MCTDYPRSAEDMELLGLTDMKTENYDVIEEEVEEEEVKRD